MKNIIVLLLLFSYLHASAQEDSENKYFIGINSGFNASRLNTESSYQNMFYLSTDQNFKSGYSGGIVFIYYSEHHKGIQLEFNYSQRGWMEDLDSANHIRTLEYLEFPILSHFDIGKKNLKFSIILGPAISYLISSREQTNFITENQSKSYYTAKPDNKLEGGLCLGIGVNKCIKNGIIQLECRFNQGLSNIFSEELDIDLLASQNQSASIKLSYLFGW